MEILLVLPATTMAVEGKPSLCLMLAIFACPPCGARIDRAVPESARWAWGLFPIGSADSARALIQFQGTILEVRMYIGKRVDDETASAGCCSQQAYSHKPVTGTPHYV